MFLQESVETGDVTVDVSSPTTYIHSHEPSMPDLISSGDGVVVTSSSAVTFDSIQPSSALISSSTTAVTAALDKTSSPALAVDLTTSTSPQLPALDSAASRYTHICSVALLQNS